MKYCVLNSPVRRLPETILTSSFFSLKLYASTFITLFYTTENYEHKEHDFARVSCVDIFHVFTFVNYNL